MAKPLDIPEVFISYKRGESHELALKIKQFIEQEFHYQVVWDESGIDTGGDIRAYMNRLAKGTYIIFLLTPEFLLSPYCMYELSATANEADFKSRVVAVLPHHLNLDRGRIMDTVDHWGKEMEEFQARIATTRKRGAKQVTPKMQEELRVLEGIAKGSSTALFNIADKRWLQADNGGEISFEELGAFLRRWVKAVEPRKTVDLPTRRTMIWVGLPFLLGLIFFGLSVIPWSDVFTGASDEYVIQKLLEDMQPINGGSFTMGDNTGPYEDERHAHQVTISAFAMGRHEVTQAQWKAVMGTNPSYFKDCDQCPVENVSWNDIQKFLNKINEKTKQNFRLPTEAEWEYAAKAGNASQQFAGSNDLDSIAWFSHNSGEKTHSVGGKAENGFQLFDMTGNVREFCRDSYDPYYYKKFVEVEVVNPLNNGTGYYRVLRGGSWSLNSDNCRIEYRSYCAPNDTKNDVGFRIAKD